MKTIQEIFPRASQSFIEANPATTVSEAQKNAVQPIVEPRRGKMNKIETEFSLILEAMRRKGEIEAWEFEGITLRFAGVKYTPDFVVWDGADEQGLLPLRFIEIKGAFIKGKLERAIERFRHARTYYYGKFNFEMHQKTKEGWKVIL